MHPTGKVNMKGAQKKISGDLMHIVKKCTIKKTPKNAVVISNKLL